MRSNSQSKSQPSSIQGGKSPQESKATKGPKASKEPRASKESNVLRESKASKESSVSRESKASKESSVSKESSASTLFEERLKKHMDELKWLYAELYHDEQGKPDQQALAYFLQVLRKNAEEHSEELKAWDHQKEQNPDWYRKQDLTGMMMYTECFGENLAGVRSHLDYLKECGISYLHLMPLLQSPKGRSDGGYAVSDFRTIEPELGTMEDLSLLTRACHEEGIVTCLDFVMNHTSEDHEWAKRARAGEKEYQDRFFFYDNWDIPNAFERTVPQVFPQTAPGNFTWCEEAKKVVMTTFYPYQWDLNYANPVVFNDMTDNLLFLCNRGIDVIRLDATPYIWKSLGTNCRNLPQVHSLVRLLHIAADIVCPGTLMLGEVVMEPKEVVPYFGSVEKPECDLLYNVTTMACTWHTVATRDVRLLKHQLATTFALPKEYTFLNYLRCHDDIGWGLDYGYLQNFGITQVAHKKYLNDYLTGRYYGSDARGELYNDDPRLGDARLCGTTASLCGVEAAEYEKNEEKLHRALRKDIMLHAFLLTLSGIPVLYSGDEIAQLNDYSYHEDPLKWEDSRYLHRGKFLWEDEKKRKRLHTRQGEMFRALKRLLAVRAKNLSFHPRAESWIIETYNDHVLGIGRYYEGRKLIALFNFSEEEEIAWINEEGRYKDLISKKRVEAKSPRIQAFDFLWMQSV